MKYIKSFRLFEFVSVKSFRLIEFVSVEDKILNSVADICKKSIDSGFYVNVWPKNELDLSDKSCKLEVSFAFTNRYKIFKPSDLKFVIDDLIKYLESKNFKYQILVAKLDQGRDRSILYDDLFGDNPDLRLLRIIFNPEL